MNIISKSLFSMQRAAQEPRILRELARRTGIPYSDLKDEVANLKSKRQPLAQTLEALLKSKTEPLLN